MVCNNQRQRMHGMSCSALIEQDKEPENLHSRGVRFLVEPPISLKENVNIKYLNYLQFEVQGISLHVLNLLIS